MLHQNHRLQPRSADSLFPLPSLPALQLHLVPTLLFFHRSGSQNRLVNPFTYTCHDCRKTAFDASKRIRAKSTLVLTPAHICTQWLAELKKHFQHGEDDFEVTEEEAIFGQVHGLKYLFYPGINSLLKAINNGKGSPFPLVSSTVHTKLPLLLFPEFLAQFDIVVAHYDAFTQDYNAFVSQKRELRRQSTFPSIMSPLFCLDWWRLVLDEMHLVESSSRLLNCCLELSKEKVWCVSGTPFNTSLDEMSGVMSLLGVYHYCNASVWRQCISVPALTGREA